MATKQDKIEIGRVENAVNTYSRPSDLRITDMRLAVVASNYDYPILKIDTNQGVYGLGEVRDAGHAENALQFKNVLLGQNPCNVDMIFRAIKQYGNWAGRWRRVRHRDRALGPDREGLRGSLLPIPRWQVSRQGQALRRHPVPGQPDARGIRQGRSEPSGSRAHIHQVRVANFFETADNALLGHDAKYDYKLDAGKYFKAPGAGRGVKMTKRSIEAAVAVVAAVRQEMGTKFNCASIISARVT